MSKEKPSQQGFERESQRLTPDEIEKLKQEFGVQDADNSVFLEVTDSKGEKREYHFLKIIGFSALRKEIIRVKEKLEKT